MKRIVLLLAISLLALISSTTWAIETVKSGEKIMFLGDSVTWFGGYQGGFIPLIMDGLKKSGIKASPVNAGRPGDTSGQILDRVKQYVFKQKADWLILKCGLNDVSRSDGKNVSEYKKNIQEILDRAAQKKMKVIVLSPTVWESDSPRKESYNEKIKAYCKVLQEICETRGIPLIDLNNKMRQKLQTIKDSKNLKLTVDTIHMNGYGNQMIAESILETLGVSKNKIDDYKKEWNTLPSMTAIINNPQNPSYFISINDYEVLRESATHQGLSVSDLIKKLVKNYVEEHRKQ